MALFTVSEARAFDQAKLADTDTYPTADIEAAEVGIHDWLYANCGVRFAPTTESNVYRDGDGSATIWVVHHRLSSVTACVIYDADGTAEETFDADDLADLAVYPEGKIVRKTNGLFLAGNRNVKLTYVHGWPAVPYKVKRAALAICVKELLATDISSRVTQMADGEMRYNFSVAGRGKTEVEGIPDVDTVLRTHDERMVGWLG